MISFCGGGSRAWAAPSSAEVVYGSGAGGGSGGGARPPRPGGEGFAAQDLARYTTAGCRKRMLPASASISTIRPSGNVNLRLMWPNSAPL